MVLGLRGPRSGPDLEEVFFAAVGIKVVRDLVQSLVPSSGMEAYAPPLRLAVGAGQVYAAFSAVKVARVRVTFWRGDADPWGSELGTAVYNFVPPCDIQLRFVVAYGVGEADVALLFTGADRDVVTAAVDLDEAVTELAVVLSWGLTAGDRRGMPC